ncbi:hypothetical protein MATL_G00192300 [Megalops atlanticus]|uniref:Uncharacterized protein n=1 Tax=Megalops atlanticus TaxID=7932 RepID=A0A9D3T5C5_MEGAT|nr:hypothetical protein MATL_G00192300 [Megalops atlanticus]
MTTENNQNQFTSPSQMDPVVNSEKCQKHSLVCTTASSLDKSAFNVWDLCPPSSGLAINAEFVQGSGINPASDELQMRTFKTHHRSNNFLNVLGMNCCQIRTAFHIQNWTKYQMMMNACLTRNTHPTHSLKMMMMIQMQACPLCRVSRKLHRFK